MPITRVTVDSLRGFQSPVALHLSALNVLVGRNGVGKSTIVDALFLGSAHNPADALGRVVRRRVGVQHGARWLMCRNRDGATPNATISVDSADGMTRQTRISSLTASSAVLVEDLVRRSSFLTADDIQSLALRIDDGNPDADHRASFEVAFEPRNSYAFKAADVPEALRLGAWVRLVDAKLIGEPLTDAFSRAVTMGGIPQVVEMLKQSEPGISDLQILTAQDQPYLAATVRGVPMPLSLVGDGIRLLARLAFEIQSMRDGGVLLVEEPELHQHPKAIQAIARALVEASHRGVQVVVTTHSLELASSIKLQFDFLSEAVPDLALVCVERDESGQCELTRIVGREVFHDEAWPRFKERFSR